nr:hypothetical protein [Tanacetum cinerariifolium]
AHELPGFAGVSGESWVRVVGVVEWSRKWGMVVTGCGRKVRRMNRSKLNYFWFIKKKLDVKRRILFRSTCFGPWLDLMLFDHEPLLIDYMLRGQHKVDDQHHDMTLIYYMEGHKLHFGLREFSIITGFHFGTVSFDLHSSGRGDLCKLSDDDAIRLCLLLALEDEHLWCHLYDKYKNLKERHGDEHYYRLFKDRNYVPTYTLSGFVFAFQRHLKDVKVGGLKTQK